MISGAPPAEYGGKTSLVIVATTRSGQGLTKPTGDFAASYGTFGSATGSFDLGYGGKNWGNFVEFDGLNTGRFLDPPEFVVFHDKGNEENLFDRVDYQFTPVDSIHLNLNYSRSWFQTPNAYDNLNVSNVVSGGAGPDPVFGNVGNTDQHSKIETFDIAPTYTRIFGTNAVFNFGAYVRRDAYNYYPSGNPLADLGPRICKPHRSHNIGHSPMPGCAQISPIKRESTTSRWVRSTSKRSCVRMTVLASSTPPTTPPASMSTAIRSRDSPIPRNALQLACIE